MYKIKKIYDKNEYSYRRYRNSEHYKDETAGVAIRTVDEETYRVRKLLKTIFNVCDIAGYRIKGNFTIEDKNTGREWNRGSFDKRPFIKNED